MEDDSIIGLDWTRNESAIEETAKKYGSWIRGVAMNILRNKEDSEEIENDTYVRTWNSIPPARPRVLKYYLTRIARNLSFDRLDYFSAKKRESDVSVLLDELEGCIPDPQGSAEELVEKKQLAVLLNGFLGELDPLDCCLFISRYYYAMPLKDVACKYGLSPGKTKYSLLKTRERLRQKLTEEGFDT